MFATDFEFAGELASSYGLVICKFDGSTGVETLSNGADIALTTVRVPGSNIWNHVYSQYAEVLSTTFSVGKNPCYDDGDPYFSVEQQRMINRWLNRLDKYYPFRIVQDGYEHIYFNAQINAKKVEIGGKVVGFELSVVTNAPYGFYGEQVYNMFFDKGINTLHTIVDQSDDIGMCDTIFEITFKTPSKESSFNIDLIDYDGTPLRNETMWLKNCYENETITINSRTKKITSSNPDRDMAKFLADANFSFTWLHIYNNQKSRNNVIKYSGDSACEVKVRYTPVAKIGL